MSSKVTANDIRTLLHDQGVVARWSGSYQVVASRPASLAKTSGETISFCRQGKSVTPEMLKAWQGIVLIDEVSESVRSEAGKRVDLLIVESEFSEAIFYLLLSMYFINYRPQQPSSESVSARVDTYHRTLGMFTSTDDDVILGESVSIGPNCSIRRAQIGNSTVLQAGVCLGDDALGAVLGPNGQWIDRPHFAGVVIGRNVRIENNSVIQAGFLTPTMISDNCRIGPLTSIGNGVFIGQGTLIGQSVTIAGSVRIGRNCRIWSNASIRESVTIGDGATVGMGAAVVTDIPSNEVWFGNPARKRLSITPTFPKA